MWRTLIVSGGEKITTKDNWLLLYDDNSNVKRIPISELYCIVIDNVQISISVPTIIALAKSKVNIIFCDKDHLPHCQAEPLNSSYHAYGVLKRQFELTDEFKGEIWKRIVICKIHNQANCLSNLWCERKVINRMNELAEETLSHDKGNREGIAAKLFFREAYGSGFVRFAEDNTNAALNYGYAIMRSCVVRALVSYGFNCVLGIHHISEFNEFNLADDFMEPFRPIIDEWVANHIDVVTAGLTKDVRVSLIDLVNRPMLVDGKRVKVRYAIDIMVKSFVTAIKANNANKLILPQLIIQG